MTTPQSARFGIIALLPGDVGEFAERARAPRSVAQVPPNRRRLVIVEAGGGGVTLHENNVPQANQGLGDAIAVPERPPDGQTLFQMGACRVTGHTPSHPLAERTAGFPKSSERLVVQATA